MHNIVVQKGYWEKAGLILGVSSRFAESRFAESRFAESRFAESRLAECRLFPESRVDELRLFQMVGAEKQKLRLAAIIFFNYLCYCPLSRVYT